MTFYKIKLLIIALILLIAGCVKKDELTLPVRVHFKIGLGDQGGDIFFTGGQIGIQKIQFEGRREAGGDVFFETDPNIDLPVIEFQRNLPFISDFDIPQGIYNYIKWDIYLKKIKTDEAIVDFNTDSLGIGLVINGTYHYNDLFWSGKVFDKPVVLAIDYTTQFSVRSNNSQGTYTIVLSENKDYEADLILNLHSAIQSAYPELFEILDDSLHQKIMISSSENKNLYDIISNQIATSAKVIIK